jgi:hypothetical protein
LLWSTEYKDKLPDSSFAYISPSGHKDSEGKTTPRSLRHLPYKDADGRLDEIHVRSALSKVGSTQIPASAKEEAFGKLKAAAKSLNIDVDENRKFSDMPPLKIPVGRIGKWKHPKYGDLKMSQQTFDDMIRNFHDKTIGRDPFIRIGHDLPGTFGSTPSEGWIQDLSQEGDTLFALVDPTNSGIVDAVKNKKYRYASPEYDENYKSKEDGSSKGAALTALALTNEPFLTHLPEARLLADPPGTLYLDYEEVNSNMEDMKQLLDQQKETNGFLRKLSDFFTGKKPGEVTLPGATPPAAGVTVTPPAQTPEQIKLAEMQTQLAATQVALRTAEVERKLAEYTAQGIPPAVLQQYRPILLADDGQKTIKLSDDKGVVTEVSVSDQIYASLNAFPQEGRVKLSQVGEQTTPPKPDSPEAVKKLADETMTELGYEVDEKGHYKLAQ